MADSVYDAKLDTTTISQVFSTDISNNIAVFTGRYSGGVDPSMRAVLRADARATVKTGDLVTLLTAVGISTGANISGAGVTLPWNERASGGTFGATAGVITATGAFAYMTSVDASQDAEDGATGTFEIIPVWDGSTAPFVSATGETLDAQSFISAFALGPAKIGTAAIAGLTGISVKPGVGLLQPRYSGSPFIESCYINSRDPQITLTFESFASLHAFGAMYGAMSSSLVCYLRKRTAGGTYVANATTQHIAFTLSGGIGTLDSISGSGMDNSSKTLTVHGTSLSVSTASAIVPGS